MLSHLPHLAPAPLFSVLSFTLAMLFSPAAFAIWGADCKPSTSSKPYWINTPGKLPVTHVYGIGMAEHQQDSRKQTEQAILNAKAQLAANIESEVWAEYQREDRIHGTQHSSRTESYQKSSSIVKIPGIKPQESWMDNDCRLHVLLAIPEATRRLLSQKALMEQYQARAQDSSTAIPERLKAIDSAINIATRNDFSRLPNSLGSKHLLKQHCQLRHQVSSLMSSQNTGLFWIGNDAPEVDIRTHLIPALTPKVSGIAYRGHCSNLADCLKTAQQQGVQHALVAHSQLNFQRKGPFYQGLFQMQLELYNATSGKKRFGTSNHHRQANIIHHQQQQMNKGVGIQKWLNQHPAAFQELSNIDSKTESNTHIPERCKVPNHK